MGLERGGSKKLLDQVGHIHGHLFDGGVVEGLDVPQCALVIFGHHVNSHTLPAKAASSSNPDNITEHMYIIKQTTIRYVYFIS